MREWQYVRELPIHPWDAIRYIEQNGIGLTIERKYFSQTWEVTIFNPRVNGFHGWAGHDSLMICLRHAWRSAQEGFTIYE